MLILEHIRNPRFCITAIFMLTAQPTKVKTEWFV